MKHIVRFPIDLYADAKSLKIIQTFVQFSI